MNPENKFMKSDIDPRLGFLERATWCLSHMLQKNSDHENGSGH